MHARTKRHDFQFCVCFGGGGGALHEGTTQHHRPALIDKDTNCTHRVPDCVLFWPCYSKNPHWQEAMNEMHIDVDHTAHDKHHFANLHEFVTELQRRRASRRKCVPIEDRAMLFAILCKM